MAWATESGHWYTKDGEPAYVTLGTNGKERPTTLRDARKLGLVPSVTTIIRCASAPGLERWKADQLLLAGLTLPKLPDEREKDWISRVYKDSQEQGRKAAEHGTRIHGAIEGHFQGKVPDEEMWPYVKGAIEVLKPLSAIWKTEKSFASPLGFGGKVDLHADELVIDFKGKDGDLTDVICYDEHYMQCAAYAYGLMMEKPRCGIVFVSRTHPSIVKLIMHNEDEINRGWTMFAGLLHYWKAANQYGEATREGT